MISSSGRCPELGLSLVRRSILWHLLIEMLILLLPESLLVDQAQLHLIVLNLAERVFEVRVQVGADGAWLHCVTLHVLWLVELHAQLLLAVSRLEKVLLY